MRTTVVEKLNCERNQAYDENRHDILDREIQIRHELLKAEKGSLSIRFEFVYRVVSREKKDVWGTITGQALTVITDPSIEPIDEGKHARMAGNIPLVIDGALSEDVFLPLSVMLRAMKLPPILVVPPLEQAQPPTADKPKPAPAKP